MKTTIHDVAKEANVSIATVSKALNDVDVVHPKTKQKVIDAANKLHYVPNLLGKHLKSKETKMIGFYTHTIIGQYFTIILEAIVEEAKKFGYGVTIFISSDWKMLPEHILGNSVDGFIGFEDMISEADLDLFIQESVKGVLIDREISYDNIGSVTFESFEAGKNLTNYLISQGHKKIAFLKGHPGVYDSEKRLEGYLSALKEHNIPYNSNYVYEGLFEEKVSMNNTEIFLKKTESSELPTAFIGGNDLSAIGIVKALNKNGYQVPEDFSVVGFDDIDILNYFTPHLTSVYNPFSEQGKLAIQHLIRLMSNKEKGDTYKLECQLKIRDSVKKVVNE